MYLKRIFNHDEAGKPTTVRNVEVLREPKSRTWHPSPNVIEKGVSEGWLSLADGHVVLRTADGKPDVRYRILRGPGRYCCACGMRLESGPLAQRHVLKEHAGVEGALPGDDGDLARAYRALLGAWESPDPENTSGYAWLTYYDCERVED